MNRKLKAAFVLICCALCTVVLLSACQFFTATLESISAVYEGEDIPIGGTIVKSDFKVTASYSYGKDRSVTDFTISDIDSSTSGDKSVTVTFTDNGVTKTTATTVTVYELVDITVQYDGRNFFVGDSLQKTAFKVTAVYSNDKQVVLKSNDFSATGFSSKQAGDVVVTISYSEHGKTFTKPVTVTIQERPLPSLVSITARYLGGSIEIGAQPDKSLLVVTAHYDDNSSQEVTDFNVGTVDSSSSGVKNWEISYTYNDVTKSTTVKITVAKAGQSGEVGEPQEGEYDVNVIKNENLSIHFLELGNLYTGDCVYIKAGDVDILIDAGSREASAATIANYVNQYCTDGILEYVIVTHAHQDHIAGFVGTNTVPGIFARYRCENVIQFARTGQSETTGSGNRSLYGKYVDARNAEKTEGANVYTALDCVNNANGAQKVYNLTPDGSITMEILYQQYYEKNTSNENNYSVCILISQGDNHYLFTGDLEDEGETSLVNSNPGLPEVELYKGGHHGSYTAANELLMETIKPKTVCICCCAGNVEYLTGATHDKQNLAHSFPAQEFVDRVAPYTDKVYVTTRGFIKDNGTKWVNDGYESMNGNIVFACTDGQITMYFSHNNLKLKDTEWFKANRTCPSAWA